MRSQHIKLFVDVYTDKNVDIYQSTGGTSILMNFLNMYNSREFKKLISEQNTYIVQ